MSGTIKCKSGITGKAVVLFAMATLLFLFNVKGAEAEEATTQNRSQAQGTAKSASQSDDSGLVGAWRFNAGSGDRIADLSTSGNEAKIINGRWINEQRGPVLMLNGKNAYVDCGTGASLDISGPITIEAWVNGFMAGTSGQQETIVNRGNQYWLEVWYYGVGGGHITYRYWGKESKQWVTCRGFWKGSGSGALYAGGAIQSRQWNHVVVVNDFVSPPRIYLNGVLNMVPATELAMKYKVEENAGWGPGARLIIGNYGEKTYAPFNGKIGYVAVYNKAIWTDEDVMRRYQETQEAYR